MTREEHLKLSRDWKLKNAEKVKAYRKKYYQENKSRTSKYNKLWAKENLDQVRKTRRVNSRVEREKYPEKIEARRQLNIAVKKGLVIKKPCFCGSTQSQGHHHKGYSKDSWLDVKWLCARHHTDMHLQI